VPEADRELARLLAEHDVPGAVLGILEHGETTVVASGVADVRTGEPVTPETRFAVGSLAKSVLATAIARVASLDDSVAEHVPELPGARWAERAALRDLLGNRARVPLTMELEFGDFPGADPGVLSRFAAAVAAETPTEAFWSYTNAGWSLLGRALEVLTGLTFEQALEETAFEPFGLSQTTFVGRPAAEPRAGGHHKGAPVDLWAPAALAPAGTTLLSTAGDLLRLAEAHFDDPVLAELRTQPSRVPISGWLDAWCLGWARFDRQDGPIFGWDGLTTGFRSALRFDPVRRRAHVLLTNGSRGRNLYRALFDVPTVDLEPRATGDLSGYAGVYAWPDRVCTVTAEKDRLSIEADGRTLEARPLDERTFVVDAADPDNPTVTFSGDVLYLMLWGLPRVR
jgi:CubicO group peptidase (beta-lactamase class C family)